MKDTEQFLNKFTLYNTQSNAFVKSKLADFVRIKGKPSEDWNHFFLFGPFLRQCVLHYMYYILYIYFFFFFLNQKKYFFNF